MALGIIPTITKTLRRGLVFAQPLVSVIWGLDARLLEMFVDPSAFETLPHVQQRLFTATGMLLTGAVLSGGSDALHQLVLVFTNFFQSAAGRVKGTGAVAVGGE
jgi:hypothetical protein